jgi:short-subunit dehydrogenase
MQAIQQATVLITGGSKGIGAAIAEEFAKHGHHLILVARSQADLNKTSEMISSKYNTKVRTVVSDLAKPQAPDSLFKQLNDEGVTVDILVNNAGVGVTGHFAKHDLADTMNMLQLNMMALTRLTHLFLQPMLERKKGRILNVGSVVSYFSGAPNWAAYVATKHYVKAFSKGLSRELKNTGVSVTLLSPGTTKTDFVTTADAVSMRAYRTPSNVTPVDIAKLAYKSCQAGKGTAIPGLFNKILAFLGELPPRVIAFEIFAFLSQKSS